jgi:hypothetical protein
MSAISSTSTGSTSNLYQFLQNLQQSSGTSSASGSGSSVQGTHHHHRHGGGGGGGGLMSQIEDAVTSALQGTQSSGSTSNANQIVQNAITQVLQNGSTSGTTTTAAASGAGTTTAGGSAAPSPQAFLQTLQTAGVTPQQFLSDFMAALQATQGGQGSSASSLTGSLVNATA